MSILYIVLPLALILVLAAVLAFVWAARRGQFDDLETPALRMIPDDEGDNRKASQVPHAGVRNSPPKDAATSC